MPTSLQGIAEKAQSQKRYRFRNLYGMLDEELLKEGWREIKTHAAYGVDQISARAYEQPLEENIRDLVERLKQKDVKVVLDDKARDFLIEKGFDPAYGARPMRRAVEKYLEDPMAEELLKGTVSEINLPDDRFTNDARSFYEKSAYSGTSGILCETRHIF